MSPLKLAEAVATDIAAANERSESLRDALTDIIRATYQEFRVMPRECPRCGAIVSIVVAVHSRLLCTHCTRSSHVDR